MVRFRLSRVIALTFLFIALLVPVSAASARTTDVFGAGLGASRADFEARYGAPKSQKGAADFNTGTEYAIPGYKSVFVFWHNDVAARIVLNAANGWPGPKAANIVNRWIPADARSTGAGGGANTDGYSWVTTDGHSNALAKRFSARTYQQYEVDGKQGDFRVALVKRPGNADAFSTIDIAIGTNVTLATSTTADGQPQGKTDAKGDRYLAAVRANVNDLFDSMKRFITIMNQKTIGQSDIDQLQAITQLWLRADTAARQSAAPIEYEKVQGQYEQLTGALNVCGTNLNAFIASRGNDQDAFNGMLAGYDDAMTTYHALDDALTAAGV